MISNSVVASTDDAAVPTIHAEFGAVAAAPWSGTRFGDTIRACAAAPRRGPGFGDTIHVCAAAAGNSYVSSLTFGPVAVAVAVAVSVAHACATVACVRVLLPGFCIRRLLLRRAAAAAAAAAAATAIAGVL